MPATTRHGARGLNGSPRSICRLSALPPDRAQPIARNLPLPGGVTTADARAAFALLAARLAGSETVDLALDLPGPAGLKPGLICDWVPVRADLSPSFAMLRDALQSAIDAARTTGGFTADLLARLPGSEPPTLPALGLSDSAETGLVDGTALTLAASGDSAMLLADKTRISDAALDLWSARLAHLLAHLDAKADPATLPILPEAERSQVLTDWNATASRLSGRDLHPHRLRGAGRPHPRGRSAGLRGRKPDLRRSSTPAPTNWRIG